MHWLIFDLLKNMAARGQSQFSFGYIGGKSTFFPYVYIVDKNYWADLKK